MVFGGVDCDSVVSTNSLPSPGIRNMAGKVRLIGTPSYVRPVRGYYRDMGTVSRTPDIFTPIKPLKETARSSGSQFSSEIQRILSFATWDTHAYGALQSLLAKAGFFYTGVEDKVECFACGITLSDWNQHKDPAKEHAAISPSCLYQKLNIPLSEGIESSLALLDTPESKPVQDSPAGIELSDISNMQCDLKTQTNNNAVRIEALQSLPAIKNSLPNNESYRRYCSINGGEDVPDMFDIADPKEQGAHPQVDMLRNETCRIQTFRDWPTNAPVTVAELARSGFFYVGPKDRVQCAFCRGILRNWAPGDSAMDEHKKHFPRCNFIKGNNVGNIPLPAPATSGYPASMSLNQGRKLDLTSNDADMYEETGIIDNTPKHPELAIRSARLNTFKNWPRNVTQTPQKLAECGFYSLGIDDSVKCFFCDGGLRSWEPNDDPWEEHARWFKTCGYLRQTKGQEYIQQVNARHPSYPVSAPEVDPVEPMVTSSPENDVISSVAESPEDTEVRKQMTREEFKQVFEAGFTEEQVSQIIRRHFRNGCKTFSNAQELIEAIITTEDSPEEGSDSGEESLGSKEVSHEMMVDQTAKDKTQQCASEPTTPSPSAANSAATSSPPTSTKEKKKKKKKEGASSDPTRTRSLEEQIRALKEERVCKVCLDEVISIVFLPCGHMVCCGTCAPALRTCPICRENIKGNVKAFIS